MNGQLGGGLTLTLTLNLNQVGDDLLGGCTGTWVEDWDKFERTVNLDHVLLYP